jgi:hypothetical protein
LFSAFIVEYRRTKHIVWDEQNLQHNDANKTAKMKINEPKTPYNRGFDPEKELLSDGKVLECERLAAPLNFVGSQTTTTPTTTTTMARTRHRRKRRSCARRRAPPAPTVRRPRSA